MEKAKTRRTKLIDRILPSYSRSEEMFNFISHVIGGALAIVGLVLAVIKSALTGDAWSIVAAAIYGFTLVMLYTMSSLYHGLTRVGAKKVFQVIDHCSIFLLIAGTYTPITLCTLRPGNPGLAWTIFGVIWGAAILGIVLNAIDLKKYSSFSMICYLAMGWCIIFAIRPLGSTLAKNGIILLVAGGISYTIGALIYAIGKKKVPFMHAVFHVFVVIGSVLHFFCVFNYILPVK